MKGFKKIRTFVLFVVLLMCSPALFACQNAEPQKLYQKLSTPTDVVLDETTLVVSWSAVEDADFYSVDINGKLHQTQQTQFNISAFVAESGEYTIKVVASAISNIILDSDYSEAILLTKKDKFATPTISYNSAEYIISWQAISGAMYYTLVVNNIEFVTTETSFYLLAENVFSNVINQNGNNTFSVYCTATSDHINSDMSNQVTVDFSQFY